MRPTRIARIRRPFAGQRIAVRLSLSAFAAALAFFGTIAPAVLAAPPETITITDSLSVDDLTIEPGTMVTWINQDSERHRVRSTSGPATFDSGNLDPGESYSFTFTAEGTYNYSDARDDTNTSYFGTVAVVAGGGGGTPPPTGGATVDIVDRSYRPASLTVAAGTEVSWRNLDGSHTVTANDRSYDSGIFDTGTYRRTFNTPGNYSYFCTLHPEMQGTITVTGSDGTPPPPEPPPPTPPPTPPPPPGDVSIFDNGYTPRTKAVTAGTTIVWSNTGALPHTITATSGGFDSGLVMASETYRRTFNTPGNYSYFCTLHPEMQGTITVTGSDGTPPPPEPPPPTPPPTPPPPPGDVSIFDNGYTPRTKAVTAGTTIVWSNTGALPHTITATSGGFDSGLVMASETYRRTFNTPGNYSYFCTLHPEMQGTITVTGSDGTPPPPEPPPPTPPPTPPPPPGDVSIFDNGYTPRTKAVTAGTTIVWSNTGALPHTITATSGGFDSGLVMASETYRRTFNTPGNYSYFCTLHPEMQGTITVTGTATGEPDADVVGQGVDEGAIPINPANDPPAATPDSSSTTGLIIDASIVDLDYDPRALTVEVGATIRWTNIGKLPHTVTDREATFDSGILQTNGAFELTLPDIGTYEYFCTLHPDMVGTITVVEASGRIGAVGTDSILAAPAPPLTVDPTTQLATAITAFLLVTAAGLLGGLGMLVRTLLSEDGESSV